MTKNLVGVDESQTAAHAGVDAHGLVLLDRDECLELLGRSTFGRVGVTVGALPAVLPVNFRLVDDLIVFRTGHGTKLDAATDRAIVAFEVDDIDPVTHTGWSVMVTGEARRITDPAALDRIEARGIPHWAPSDVAATVAIPATMVTGRRVGGP
jgi:nitroimidazol reductase NimA-like FMN-containing flavoprotein (pyridoxamine 5'-phosphate oxidase superfamily)